MVGVVALLGLGIWQLNRAEEKRELQHLHNVRRALPPITTVQELSMNNHLVYRNVSLTGEYLPDGHTLLDNRTHGGRAGYYVLSLFRPAGSQHLFWVNRGWVAAGRLRSDVPQIATPPGPLSIRGELRPPPAKGLYLGDIPNYTQWPTVIQYLDAGLAEQFTGSTPFPLMIYLTPESGAMVRDWPLVSVGPERHMGYAIQWFALAGVLVVMFLVTNFTTIES